MPRYADDVIIDPPEAPVVPARVPFSLTEMGLGVLDARWGESAVKGTSIQTSLGQVLVDRREEPTTIELTLEVREDSEVDLPTAAYRLQQKLGTIQRGGCWIKRVPYVGGDFAGPILYRITGVISLGDIAGWGRGEQPDVKLTLERDSIGYSTEEREQGPFTSAAGGRHLIFTESASPGTGEGLWRGRITNEGAEDLRGLIYSRENRDAPDDLNDPTAQPHYLAKNLTPKGGAEVKTVEGAEVVQHTALTAGWITILDSEIAGVGHMTHRGTRRMMMRIFDPGSTPGGVEMQLLWRPLGGSRWEDRTPILPTPAVGGWIPVDLGIARPQMAVLGDERWQWVLRVRAPGGSGAIRIRDVYPSATEQFGVLSEPHVAPLADGQTQKSAGKGSNDASAGGTAWSNPENIKATDGSRATVALNTTDKQRSQLLIASGFAFGLSESDQPLGVIATVERGRAETAGTIRDYVIKIVKDGSVVGENKAVPFPLWKGGSDQVVQYGSSSDLWGVEDLTYADVNDPDFGLAIRAECDDGSTEARVNRVAMGVYYTTAADEDRVCFAGRSIEIRSDSVLRQAPVDEVWGRLIPDGFWPSLPAGGLEARPSRTLIIPSTGDFQTVPDSGTPVSLEATTYSRDAYHFAREGA